MQCFVLGTGGMMPMPYRRLTAVAVRAGGGIYLFDCGEGTQVPYKEHHLGQRSLRVVAVTHLHADHCLGLPGLLMLHAQMPEPGPLTVLGPPRLRQFIQHMREDLAMYINYEIHVREWSEASAKLAYEDEQVRIVWQPVNHSVLCLGYRLEEQQRRGRFDAAAADRFGVPWGPLRGKLQKGESVIIEGGSTIRPEQVIGPPRRGRHVAYVTDTARAPSLDELLWEVDIAFLEGMFLPEHLAEALEKKHLTVDQAATTAQQAHVVELVLVHLSPRYDSEDVRRLSMEASRHHPRARVAREGEVFEIPLPD